MTIDPSVLYQTKGMEDSQPAQKNERIAKKIMNGSNSVMYVCPVSYISVVMFTCTLMRSHPESRRRWGETWTVVINSWVGCDNKMHARKEGPERGSVHARNEAMKDIFARCHEKTAVQVCTLTIMHCCLVTVISHAMIACVTIWCQLPILAVPVCTELITTLRGVYFPQAKNTMTRMSIYLIPAPSQTGTHWIDSID